MAHGLDHDKAFHRAALEPGVFVLVAIDPVATLAPLNDPHATHQAGDMVSSMYKYLAFVRTVDLPISSVAVTKARRASAISPPLAISQPKLHINLVHTAPPRRVPGEGVDESMCVPVWPTRPKEACGRPPLKPTNYLGWKDVFVHTVMDAHVRVSHCDQRGFRPAVAPVLPPREMLRFDRYQQEDHARESESYKQETQVQHHHHPDVIPVQHGSHKDSVSGEDLDDADIRSENYRLSTLMSGITFDAHTRSLSSSASSIEIHPQLPRPAAPQISHPMHGASRQRPISIASTNSTFSFRTIATLSSEASDSPDIPTFWHPSSGSDPESDVPHARRRKSLSPPSPTAATDLSGPTRVANSHANSSSTLAKPGSLHHKASQAFSTRRAPSTDWAHPSFDESDEEEEHMPSKGRNCDPHVKVWFDLSMIHEPADPREFFEELKALRAIEYASDLRYLEELRRVNAEKVAAWNQLTVPLPASIPISPIKRWSPKQKSLPPTPTTATFPPLPVVPKECPLKDTPLHYLDHCLICAPPSAWSSSNNVHFSVTSTQNAVKTERRKSGASLKPLKTLWMKMKSHSNLKAA